MQKKSLPLSPKCFPARNRLVVVCGEKKTQQSICSAPCDVARAYPEANLDAEAQTRSVNQGTHP